MGNAARTLVQCESGNPVPINDARPTASETALQNGAQRSSRIPSVFKGIKRVEAKTLSNVFSDLHSAAELTLSIMGSDSVHLYSEAMFVVDLYKFLKYRASPAWNGQHLPQGDGERIGILPGFLESHWMMRPIADFLSNINYDPCFLGPSTNMYRLEDTLRVVGGQIDRYYAETGRKMTLIGQSLGGDEGILLAQERPHAIKAVLTYDSPIEYPLAVAKEIAIAAIPIRAANLIAVGIHESRKESRRSESGNPLVIGLNIGSAFIQGTMDAIHSEMEMLRRVNEKPKVTVVAFRGHGGIVAHESTTNRYVTRNVETEATHIGQLINPDGLEKTAYELARIHGHLKNSRRRDAA